MPFSNRHKHDIRSVSVPLQEVVSLPLLKAITCIQTIARCSSVVRAFAHGAMGRGIDPAWGGPVELFLVPACAPRLV